MALVILLLLHFIGLTLVNRQWIRATRQFVVVLMFLIVLGFVGV